MHIFSATQSVTRAYVSAYSLIILINALCIHNLQLSERDACYHKYLTVSSRPVLLISAWTLVRSICPLLDRPVKLHMCVYQKHTNSLYIVSLYMLVHAPVYVCGIQLTFMELYTSKIKSIRHHHKFFLLSRLYVVHMSV